MELPSDASMTNRRPPAPQAVPRAQRDCLPIAGLVFLTASAVVSAHRLRSDASALAFILLSYFDLLLLFLCLRRFDVLGQGGGSAGEKARLKAAIWLLSAALVLGFSWRVCGVMPRAVVGLIWLLAGSVTLGGFYGLFIYKEAP